MNPEKEVVSAGPDRTGSRLVFARTQIRGFSLPVCLEVENGKPVSLIPLHDGKESREGCIYVGQVEKISTDTQAVFVRIGPDFRGYLPLKGSEKAIRADGKDSLEEAGALRSGECILVQVQTEGIKGKLPSLTAALDFQGRLLVLTAPSDGLGVSRKLDQEKREELRFSVQEIRKKKKLTGLPSYGLTVRTNAAQAGLAVLEAELDELLGVFQKTVKDGKHRPAGALVFQPSSPAVRILAGVPVGQLKEIVTDDPLLKEELETALAACRLEVQPQVRLYQDPLLSLDRLYGIPGLLEDLGKEKVWLKSGGFLVIQQTEAFVCIDVNTGKFTGKKRASAETFERINREAAEEICRQVRLRNLSGIILVDFINMEEPAARERLLELVRGLTRKDRIRFEAIDITPLQIMELIRQKRSPSLAEELKKMIDG